MGDGRANQNGLKKTKKRMTEKAIEANRQNAQKSTGPKTQRADGQAPNIKHGILASIKVLPEVENQQEWDDFVAGLKEDLHPSGTLEVALAERIAWIMWRLRRLARYEGSIIEKQFDISFDEFALRYTSEEFDLTSLNLLKLLHCEFRQFVKYIEIFPKAINAVDMIMKGTTEYHLDSKVGLDIINLLFILQFSNILTTRIYEAKGYFINTFPNLSLDDAIKNKEFSNISSIIDFMKNELNVFHMELKDYLEDTYKQLYEFYYVNKEFFLKLIKDFTILKMDAVVPESTQTESLIKMESHLNRQLMQTLHELQRLQAMRVGIAGPPLAVDVSGPG